MADAVLVATGTTITPGAVGLGGAHEPGTRRERSLQRRNAGEDAAANARAKQGMLSYKSPCACQTIEHHLLLQCRRTMATHGKKALWEIGNSESALVRRAHRTKFSPVFPQWSPFSPIFVSPCWGPPRRQG